MRQGEKKVKPRAVAVPAAAAPGAPAGCLRRVCRGLWFLFDIVRVRVSGGTVKGWKFTNDKNAGEIRYYRIAFGFVVVAVAVMKFQINAIVIFIFSTSPSTMMMRVSCVCLVLSLLLLCLNIAGFRVRV